MTNIEKLYELAKVKKEYYSFKTEEEEFTWELDENGNDKHNCIFCGEPEIKTRHFTPANQLELIKWLCVNTSRNYFKTKADYSGNNWYMECNLCVCPIQKDFSQALANLVCELWEDLTPEQREEIKEILK